MTAYSEFIRPASTLRRARVEYRQFLTSAITRVPLDTRGLIALASNSVTGFVLGRDKDLVTGLLPRSAVLAKLRHLDSLTPEVFESVKRKSLKADKLLAGLLFLDYLLEHSGHEQASIADVELPVGLIVEYFQSRQADAGS